MRASRIILSLSLLVAACGPSNPEILLAIGPDGSQPCLGAAHLELQVIGDDGVSQFHEFGQFFGSTQPHACTFGQYRFSDLSLGRGIQVSVNLWDSTSDDKGLLASGMSLPIDVTDSTPSTQLEVTLTRAPSKELGSIIVTRPVNWSNVTGIDKLQYRVTPIDAQQPVRGGLFAYVPESRPEYQFPLVISNVPVPQSATETVVVVEAYRGGEQVWSWTGSAYLGVATDPTVAFAQMN